MARSAVKKAPLWKQAADKLRRDILSNPARCGEQFPSLSEIARAFAISVPTAVRVVSELEAEGLVRSVRGKGTFIAGSAFPGTVKTIVNFAHSWPAHALPFIWRYLLGIQEACRQARCGMEMFSPEHLEDCSSPDDRFVVIPKSEDDPVLESLRKLKLRCVCLHCPVPPKGIDSVRMDFAAGAKIQLEHLLSFGHRRIALLCGPLESPCYAPRPKVYMNVLEKAGIPFDPQLIFETPDLERWDETIGENLDRLLALPNPPTAIVASDDLRALVALKHLKARGVDVPGEISLCGFDARAEASGSRPPLTTGDWLLERQGEMAVRTLLEKREEGEREPKDVLVKPQLVVGQSTAPLRSEGRPR